MNMMEAGHLLAQQLILEKELGTRTPMTGDLDSIIDAAGRLRTRETRIPGAYVAQAEQDLLNLREEWTAMDEAGERRRPHETPPGSESEFASKRRMEILMAVEPFVEYEGNGRWKSLVHSAKR